MKKIRWQLIIIFLTGLVVGALLLIEQPTSQTPASAPQPSEGGAYAEALIGSLQRLNPVLDFYNSVDRDVDRLLYSRLITFDDHGNPVADLADSWGISKDGTIYNFALKEGVLWHDGKPLTSADVVFTIDLLRSDSPVIPSDLQAFWKSVEVTAVSDTQLQFKLPEPFSPFLDYLSFGVLPKHLLEGTNFADLIDASFNLQPVGSGPFKFDRLIAEDGKITGVVLSANTKYYGSKPFIQQMVFRYYADDQSALDAYRNGDVQGIAGISKATLPEALAEPDLSIYTGRLPELSMVLFNLKNTDKPFLADAAVRKALYTGLNRQWIIDRILNGQGILADGPIFPNSWAYNDSLSRVEFDSTKAADMLKDAGYVVGTDDPNVRAKEGVQLSFTLIYPDTPEHTLIAQAIQKDWESIQVRVDLEAVSYDALLNERLANRDYQAALVDMDLARSPDPDPYPFWDQVQANSGQNYTQWDNKMASDYLENARVTLDDSERARLYRNFQAIFADDLPALPLYYPVYTYAVGSQVQGIRMGPLYDTADRFASVTSWYLQASSATSAPAETITP
ncbi:ABC-type dipeptide transport system, periplasmic component [Longilinea arvoryzae]|uniref:ABC-type dipeptide transport system, periplasmic component n=1 Tax=Longilinea arvoryzae TaxID=360412 RepID=A0A0S7BJ31_9CHLR|nr:peptide ABC transporter substrate-binding protein [Longilinea arvoryzae]GAP15124.1 ABC-type dipeptide transport system, periplasmic component [Longilinea arvoryzae]